MKIDPKLEDLAAFGDPTPYNMFGPDKCGYTEDAPHFHQWFRSFAAQVKIRSAIIISGLVTFIAAYHFFRIVDSWAGACS